MISLYHLLKYSKKKNGVNPLAGGRREASNLCLCLMLCFAKGDFVLVCKL